jgi:phage tail sheath protein FI
MCWATRTSRANLLNETNVATVIRDDGFRLWGNRTTSSDPAFAFLCVSRTADMIDLSIQRAHRWACDRVVSKAYFDEVTASVNAYLRQLQAMGAILGGKCWVDPDFNTTADIQAGKVTFSYDFTPPTPAERVTFRSSITDDYIANLFSANA